MCISNVTSKDIPSFQLVQMNLFSSCISICTHHLSLLILTCIFVFHSVFDRFDYRELDGLRDGADAGVLRIENHPARVELG